MKKMFILLLSVVLLGCHEKENSESQKVEEAKIIITELRESWARDDLSENSKVDRFFIVAGSIRNSETRNSLFKLYLDGIRFIRIRKEHPFVARRYYNKCVLFMNGMDCLIKDHNKETIFMWMSEGFDFSNSFQDDKGWFETLLSRFGINKNKLSKNGYPRLEIIKKYQKKENLERKWNYTYAVFKDTLDIFKKIESMIEMNFHNKLPSMYAGLDEENQIEFVKLYRKYINNKPNWISQMVWQYANEMVRKNAERKIELLSQTWEDKKYFNIDEIIAFVSEITSVYDISERKKIVDSYLTTVMNMPALQKYPFEPNYYYARYNFFKIGISLLFAPQDETALLMWLKNWVTFYKTLEKDKICYKKILSDFNIDFEGVTTGRINELKPLPIEENTFNNTNLHNRYTKRKHTYGDCNRFFKMFDSIDFFLKYDFFRRLPQAYLSISNNRKTEFVQMYKMIYSERPEWIPENVWQSTEEPEIKK